MKQIVVFLILVTIKGFTTTVVRAQNNCLDNLESASRAYYNGNFEVVLNLLGDCDLSAVEKNSRSEVLELLIKSHLLLDETDKADSLMNSLLLIQPLYQPIGNDILLFRELHDSYSMENKFNFGLIAGFNLPSIDILKYQSISSVTREPLNYAVEPGLKLGLEGEVMAIPNLFINLGFTYENFSYSYSEIILEYQQLDVEEKRHIINLPVSLRYEVPIGKFKPFVRLGMANHFLISSKLGLDFRAIPTDIPNPFTGIPYKTEGYDISFQRKTYAPNYLVGVGLRRSIGTYHIELAMNYEHGIQNLINTDERFNDDNLLNTYFYVPDDIRLRSISFSFGIYKAILKPKKN